MSNFLRGFGRTVGLTDDDVGDDNASRASSYVEVNYLQGANTHVRAPRNAEGEQMSQQGGGGDIKFLYPKTKGALRGGDITHLSTARRRTPEGEGGQCNNKGRGDNKGALKGGTCREFR